MSQNQTERTAPQGAEAISDTNPATVEEANEQRKRDAAVVGERGPEVGEQAGTLQAEPSGPADAESQGLAQTAQ